MLFAARIGEQSVAPAHMGYAADSPLVGVEANSSALARVSSASPLRLGPAALADFQVWNLAPDTGGWALLGESSTKWVGVSAARFTSVAPRPPPPASRAGCGPRSAACRASA